MFCRHALGNRARKSGQGILTVRFEMPYPIWCTTCPKPTIIGQGVRFNAEKKKVGNYNSTPVFSFRMKHVVCGGWIEIRTDPKNTAYVVTEGAQKRDTGEDRIQDGDISIMSKEERERLQSDAFAALEVKIDDRKQAATDKGRIEELSEAREKDWRDPYLANRKMRRVFRVGRKARERDGVRTNQLKDQMSLAIDLLDETHEDRRRAKAVEFGDLEGAGGDLAVRKAQAKPLFSGGPDNTATATKAGRRSPTLPSARTAEARARTLRKDLERNTRAARDPFLTEKPESFHPPAAMVLKRKKGPLAAAGCSRGEAGSVLEMAKPLLVDYDSD